MTESFVDRSGWPPGPWDGEPDRAAWTDAGTGLACRIERVPGSGHLAGIVALPPGHPLHGKSGSEAAMPVPASKWPANTDLGGHVAGDGSWEVRFEADYIWQGTPTCDRGHYCTMDTMRAVVASVARRVVDRAAHPDRRAESMALALGSMEKAVEALRAGIVDGDAGRGLDLMRQAEESIARAGELLDGTREAEARARHR